MKETFEFLKNNTTKLTCIQVAKLSEFCTIDSRYIRDGINEDVTWKK